MLKKLLQKKKRENNTEKAIILLKTVKEGILVEKLLLKYGYTAKKVAPPPAYRQGCEISIEIDMRKKDEINTLLHRYGLEHQGIIPAP